MIKWKGFNLVSNRLKRISLKYKLIFSFIFISILPILIIQLVYYYNSTNTIKSKVNELVRFNLQQTSNNLDTSLTSYEDLLLQVFSDEDILDLVERINTESGGDKALEINALRDRLAILTYSKEGIRSITVLCANGTAVCHDRKTGSLLVNQWSGYDDVTKLDIYKEAIDKRGTVFSTKSYSTSMAASDDYVFHLAGRMCDFKNIGSKAIGVVVISIEESVLSKTCNQFYNNQQDESMNSFNFIVDASGKIISFPDKKFIGLSLIDEIASGNFVSNKKSADLVSKSELFKGRDAIINEFKDPMTGWTVINATDQSYLFREMYNMQKMSIIYGIIIIIFSLMLILYVSNSFRRSIGKIVYAMKTAQKGELNVQVDIDTKDEISIIGTSFNKMM
ncbi:MAG: cache domain-containing protein, partial [Bacteroidota bacterium]|nr:cache domain-containing protein [Bacteroidota bacterium]